MVRLIITGMAAISAAATLTLTLVSCGSSATTTQLTNEAVIVRPPTVQTAKDSEYLLKLINSRRAKEGLPQLTVDERLQRAAHEHSASMARHRYFSHKGKDGSKFIHRITRHGYPRSHSGENIAMSQSAASVCRLWYQSKGHRDIMMEGEFLRVGIARVGDYWTAVFAAPDEN